MRQPQLKTVRSRGNELAVWEWPGEDPPLLFAHATGFHGRCWDQIIQHFPDHRCLAIDARGHGRSAKPEPPYQWRSFGRDLVLTASLFEVEDAIGIGHSMGGHITTQTAAIRPETYRALLLVDPTIFPLEFYGGPAPDASFTLRRRNRFASPDEMFERFKDRPPFQSWRSEILRDYCDYGVLPDGDGYVLACPPAVEASIYENSKTEGSNIYPEIAMVKHPVVVMRADRTRSQDVFDLSASPTSPDLAASFANGREVVLADASHYIAMEAPDAVVEEIRGLM
ncbi:MAG TPA: alpha/beta hydrolase [Candidatus Solibacter sp.]|nr:alpha/beta hydrolase [Candidatus Solibacter sp.]